MNYYYLFEADSRRSPVELFHWSPSDYRTVRPRYLNLACSRCKKVPEYLALQSGLDVDIRIRSRHDFIQSDDGPLCISRKMQNLMIELGNPDCEFFELPGSPDFVVCWVRTRALCPVLPPSFRRFKLCPECQRYQEIVGIPPVGEFVLPNQPFLLCHPEVQSEDTYGANYLCLATETFVKAAQQHHLRGIEYRLAKDSI